MKWWLMRRLSFVIVTALTIAVYMGTAPDAHGIWVFRTFGGVAAAPAAAPPAAAREGVMQVTSNTISSGGEFPKRETCDGADVSPQLAWSGAPPATKSFALILDDPDAPRGTFTHWLLWDIPSATHELPDNLPKSAQVPGGGSQGRNDFGRIGYGGPCPPPGKPHRYYFRLYALDTVLSLKPGESRRADLDRAIQGHVLAQAELMARYGR